MRITALGDSLVFGYGIARPHKWTVLASQHSPGLTILNNGICGDTTAGMLSRQRGLLGTRPDAMIIMGGTNDILQTGEDSQALANMAAMVRNCHTMGVTPMVFINPPIYTGEVMDWFVDPTPVRNVAAHYNKALRELVGELDCSCIDLDMAIDWSSPEMYLDGFHPSVLGHRVIAKVVEDFLCTK